MSTRMMSRSGMTITQEHVDMAELRGLTDYSSVEARWRAEMAQLKRENREMAQQLQQQSQQIQQRDRELNELKAALAAAAVPSNHGVLSSIPGSATPVGFAPPVSLPSGVVTTAGAAPTAAAVTSRPRAPRTQGSSSATTAAAGYPSAPSSNPHPYGSQYSPMAPSREGFDRSFHDSGGPAPKKPPIVDGSSAMAGKYGLRPPISSSGSRSASTGVASAGPSSGGPSRRGPPLQFDHHRQHPHHPPASDRGAYPRPGFRDGSHAGGDSMVASSTPLNSKAPEWQPPRPTLGSSARRSEERAGEFADKAIHARPHRGPPMARTRDLHQSFDSDRRDDLVVDAIAHGHHFSSEDHERIQDSRRHRSGAAAAAAAAAAVTSASKNDSNGPSGVSASPLVPPSSSTGRRGGGRGRPALGPPSRGVDGHPPRGRDHSSGPPRDWSPFRDSQPSHSGGPPRARRGPGGPPSGMVDGGGPRGRGSFPAGDGRSRGRDGYRAEGGGGRGPGGPGRQPPPMRGGGPARDRGGPGSRSGSIPPFGHPAGPFFFDDRLNLIMFRCCPPPSDPAQRMTRGDCLFCKGRTPYLVQSKNSSFMCVKQALFKEGKIRDHNEFVDYAKHLRGRTVVVPQGWFEMRHPLNNTSLYTIHKEKVTMGFLMRNHRFVPEKRHTPKMDADTICRAVRLFVESDSPVIPDRSGADQRDGADPRRNSENNGPTRGGGSGRRTDRNGRRTTQNKRGQGRVTRKGGGTMSQSGGESTTSKRVDRGSTKKDTTSPSKETGKGVGDSSESRSSSSKKSGDVSGGLNKSSASQNSSESPGSKESRRRKGAGGARRSGPQRDFRKNASRNGNETGEKKSGSKSQSIGVSSEKIETKSGVTVEMGAGQSSGNGRRSPPKREWKKREYRRKEVTPKGEGE